MVVDKTEIKKNSDWYYANLDSLVPKYDGKFIAIIDRAVVGEYDTFANGVHAMLNSGHCHSPVRGQTSAWSFPPFRDWQLPPVSKIHITTESLTFV